jgi:hypothetical protein
VCPPDHSASGASSINVVLYGYNFYVARVKVKVADFKATLCPCGVQYI